MRFFINNETDPAYNLALEETLFRKFPEPFLMLWRNRSSVIVGKNQNTLAEVDAAFAEEHHITVIRRITGGGAVYHDIGNVNYSLLIPERHPESDSFSHFARPIVEALQKMGIPARFSGRNDIEAEGRKISGSAQCCSGNRTLFHGTLLFDADLDMLSKVLTPGKIKIEAKGIRSVRARVGMIKEYLPRLSVEGFIQALALQLNVTAGPVEKIPEAFVKEAQALADSRYRTWEWNWGYPFECTWENSAKFPAGVVTLKIRAVNSRIEEARIEGDFFGDPAPLEKALQGALLRRCAAAERLAETAVEEHIKNLTKEEFLSLINL
jgi:lipoate-protein ligase A